MKKILFFTALVALFATACDNNDLPEASFSLFQAENLKAEAGDCSVTLSWTLQEGKPAPIDQLILWTTTNDAAEDGEMTVDASTTRVVIENLVNDCTYTFSVQPRYADGLAQKISTTCMPKSNRIAPTGLKAMTGDGWVLVSWTAPNTNLEYKYNLTVEADGADATKYEVASTESSYLVENLTNGTEYTFTLTAVYALGESSAVSTKATPGEITAIAMSCASGETPHVFELCTFEYNPAYFISGETASVRWTIDNGYSSDSETITYCFETTGSHTVTVTITYTDGKNESADLTVTVAGYVWTTVETTSSYQKSNNIVFSHDGQTLYTASSMAPLQLYAINAITGIINWTYNIGQTVYGEGPVVGPDGTIFVGAEDGSLFAVTASGAERWTKKLDAAIKASPAVTSDGTLYVLTDGGVLYALDATTGSEKWKATQTGNAGGVAVDKDGTVYMGTNAGIWAYTESGSLKWTCDTAHAVTERGGSLAIYENILYATLKSKGGVAAVDTQNGQTLWTYASETNDCYHPVVDAEGSVYFCEKNGGLFVVSKDGSLKKHDTTDVNYIYSGFAIAEDGKAYISQYASPFNLIFIDTAGNREVVASIGAQTMSAVTLGPDRRVYYGLNGSIGSTSVGSPLASEGWPCRGYDAQGTNSLK